MLITQHLFLSLNFLHTRLSSIPILEYLSPFPLIYLEMLKKSVLQLIANLFLLIHIIVLKILTPFFKSLLDKPISSWLLAAETAMLEIYSTVHRHLNHKLNSQSSTFETTHLKQLPLNTFVIHTKFKPVNFSKKLKPLRIGPYKILKHLSEVTYELLSQNGSTFQTHRNHILPYYPKEPIIFPYIKHYHSTPSLINNPDTDPYQDTFSQFSSLDLQHNSNSSQTPPSSKYKQFNSSPLPFPITKTFHIILPYKII